MESSHILYSLVTGASILGAVLYSNFASIGQADLEVSVDTINKMANLEAELEQLRNENVSLRELANAHGDIMVDREWIEFIEKDNGFEFQEAPQVIRGSADEMLKSGASAWLSNFTEVGMTDRDFTFTTIGLVPQGKLAHQFGMVQSGPGTRRAMFDYERGCIIVAYDFDVKSLFDKQSLTQALAIALLEQNFKVEKALNDDAWWARRMIIHGNALITKQAYQVASQRQFNMVGNSMNSPVSPQVLAEALETFESLPYFVRIISASHRLYGRPFLEAILQHCETRKEAIITAFQIAGSSQSIMTGKETSKQQFKASPGAELSTSLGAIGIYLHASQSKLIKEPLTLIKDYESDQLEMLVKPDNSVEIHWRIQFSSQKSAQVFSEHLKDIRPELKLTTTGGAISAIHRESFLQK